MVRGQLIQHPLHVEADGAKFDEAERGRTWLGLGGGGGHTFHAALQRDHCYRYQFHSDHCHSATGITATRISDQGSLPRPGMRAPARTATALQLDGEPPSRKPPSPPAKIATDAKKIATDWTGHRINLQRYRRYPPDVEKKKGSTIVKRRTLVKNDVGEKTRRGVAWRGYRHGCIEADFSNKRFILQNISRSTKCACSSPTSKSMCKKRFKKG